MQERQKLSGTAEQAVATPWGPSDSLRSRKLRPGPGTDPEEVAQNQRERLFGALVASVSVRGYASTTLDNLVEISGVSRRTLYNLFDDKQGCFRAAIEVMLEAGLSQTSVPDSPELSWEQLTRLRAQAFIGLVAAEPAAARMALIESHIAGCEARRPVDETIVGWEAVMSRRFSESPERMAMPPEAIAAFVGGTIEISRDRLGRGREAELPDLMAEYVELLISYRPPPEPLRSVPRAPAAGDEAIEGPDHRERALRALAAVATENGYPELAIGEVLSRASMSPATFYANFTGKEDAMAAAIESAAARVLAVAIPAFRRHTDWRLGVRNAIGAIFNFFASRPALARLLLVEVYAAGPEILGRRDEALRPLEALLAEGELSSPDALPITPWAIGAGAYALAYRELQRGGAESLPTLAPICTFLALAPYVGAEEAGRIANDSGPRRRSAAAELEEEELVAQTQEQGDRKVPGASEPTATGNRIVSLIFGEIEGRVDEEGRRQLAALHDRTLQATEEILREAAERLDADGDKGTPARPG